jgi:hypothetical protein
MLSGICSAQKLTNTSFDFDSSKITCWKFSKVMATTFEFIVFLFITTLLNILGQSGEIQVVSITYLKIIDANHK